MPSQTEPCQHLHDILGMVGAVHYQHLPCHHRQILVWQRHVHLSICWILDHLPQLQCLALRVHTFGQRQLQESLCPEKIWSTVEDAFYLRNKVSLRFKKKHRTIIERIIIYQQKENN